MRRHKAVLISLTVESAEDQVATVKEAFTAKYQGNKNTGIVEVSFAVGEEVVVLKSWEGDTCLIKRGDQVFNVPKRYLSST
jgi:hypothetical protein